MQKHLTNDTKSGYHTATTKHKSAQPSRHPLAIFMPPQGIACLYGGLIGVNTKPKGNNPSRICAVVETRHPMFRAVLTKHKGVTSNGD